MDNSIYEKSALNSISRHKERGHYDKVSISFLLHKDVRITDISKETIASIVREAKILHVAWVDADGMPQCIPMIGALEDDGSGDPVLYLHGRCCSEWSNDCWPDDVSRTFVLPFC